MIKEILKNADLTYSLTAKYYRLTTEIGLCGVAVGLAMSMFIVIYGAIYFNIDIEKTIEGTLNKTIAAGSVMTIFTLSIYFGCVLVAGMFSLFMVTTGRFTLSQAKGYTFLFRYPESWFKKNL